MLKGEPATAATAAPSCVHRRGVWFRKIAPKCLILPMVGQHPPPIFSKFSCRNMCLWRRLWTTSFTAIFFSLPTYYSYRVCKKGKRRIQSKQLIIAQPIACTSTRAMDHPNLSTVCMSALRSYCWPTITKHEHYQRSCNCILPAIEV